MRKTLRLLLIEDNPREALLLDEVFQRIDHVQIVALCRNVGEAKAYLNGAGIYADRKRHPLPDGVISDLHLSVDSGFDFLKWVRASESLKGLPVLILTGSSNPAERKRAETLGADAVMEKPVGFSELRGALHDLAEQWEVRFQRAATDATEGSGGPD